MISITQICLFELISNLNTLWPKSIVCFYKSFSSELQGNVINLINRLAAEQENNQHDFIINSAEIQGTVFLF